VSIKPDIHLIYSEKIWNIFTAGNKFLLLEIRDENTLSTKFDLYNFNEKEYVWKNLTLDEQWRVGISYCNAQTILFHQYGMGSVPSVAELIAVDLTSGNKKWQVKDFQPLEFGRKYVKGLKDNHQMFVAMDSGKIVAEVGNFFEPDVMNMPLLPLRYLPDTDNFAFVKQYVGKFLGETPEGSAEYLEHNNNIFLSYHRREENQLIVKLLAITSEGNIWLNQKIDVGEKLSSDIFFIWNDHLFFIEGKHELKAIKLKGE
jgi:hypothetical protein